MQCSYTRANTWSAHQVAAFRLWLLDALVVVAADQVLALEAAVIVTIVAACPVLHAHPLVSLVYSQCNAKLQQGYTPIGSCCTSLTAQSATCYAICAHANECSRIGKKMQCLYTGANTWDAHQVAAFRLWLLDALVVVAADQVVGPEAAAIAAIVAARRVLPKQQANSA